ncbi:MAG TPA: glycosyltransferase family 1 protein [Burkholderiaceae bacterium]
MTAPQDWPAHSAVAINGVSLLSPLTGIGQYTYNLTRELHGLLPQQPWLFYGTGWSQQLRDAPMPGVDTVKKNIKRFLPQPYLVSRFIQQRIFNAGARKHRFALYHEPNFLAYRAGCPTIVSVHDLSWIRHPETQPLERVRVMNKLMPEVVERAAHIMVPTDFVRGEVLAYYGLPPERVTTTLYAASTEFQPRDAQTCAVILDRLGLRYGGYVLAVGTLEPRKNLSTAIAAYSQLPAPLRKRYPLVIAGMNGWGMDSFSPALQQLVRTGEAIVTGYVAQGELPLLYAGARMMVYPSLYEGFGLPPLEAMASGVPVIVSDRASLPEVTGGAAISVAALDDALLSVKMEQVLQDEGLHRQMVEAGLLQAGKFSWRQCAIDTLRVYQKVINAL